VEGRPGSKRRVPTGRRADGEVVLVSADEHLPYDRPPLSKDFLRGESDEDGLPLEDDDWYHDHRIEVRLRAAWGDGFDRARLVDHGDGAFTVWYGQDGVAVGVLTHGAEHDYERGQRLIKEHQPLPPGLVDER
jgi:hypothetical protein